MSIANTGQTTLSQDNNVSVHVLTPVATNAGDLVVLTYTGDTAGITISSITDSKLNTWVQVPGAQAAVVGFPVTDMWYVASNVGGSTVITVVLSGNSAAEFIVTEFSGCSASPLQTGSGANVTNTSPGGAPVSPVLTPSGTGYLCMAVAASIAFNLTGANTPWTALANTTVTGGATSYYIAPTASAQQCDYTPTTSQGYYSSGAIFEQASSGPSGAQQASTFLVF